MHGKVSLTEIYYSKNAALVIVAPLGQKYSFDISISISETNPETMALIGYISGGLIFFSLIIIVAWVLTILHFKGKLKSPAKAPRLCKCCRRKIKIGEIQMDLTDFKEVIEILEVGKSKSVDRTKEFQSATAPINA